MPSDPVHIARSRRARAVRDHGRESPEAVTAKRDLEAAKLQRNVTEVIATAPRLTDEQCQRIAALLLAGGPA